MTIIVTLRVGTPPSLVELFKQAARERTTPRVEFVEFSEPLMFAYYLLPEDDIRTTAHFLKVWLKTREEVQVIEIEGG